jgi:hypothetical protein
MKGPIRFRESLSVPCCNIDLPGLKAPRALAKPAGRQGHKTLTIISIMRMIEGSNVADAIQMSKKIMTLLMAIKVGLVIKNMP